MTTSELSALLETPTAFRRWLEAKEPGEVVGSWGEDTRTPIGLWLDSQGIGDLGDMPAADWAGMFFALCPAIPITAAECLRILDEIGGLGLLD